MRLAEDLGIAPTAMEGALARSREAREAEAHVAAEAEQARWRERFVPHAIVRTERSVTSQITFAAMVGIERILRIDLDASRSPVTFARQARERLARHPHIQDGEVLFFGRATGFVVNYGPDRAVAFDLAGRPVAAYGEAVRTGRGSVALRGREISPSPFPGEAR